jgi:hypothetical protein
MVMSSIKRMRISLFSVRPINTATARVRFTMFYISVIMKYLFKATFSDGHIVHQTHEDTSTLVPPDKNGNGPSAFYDVLHHPGTGKLDSFSLLSENGATKAFVHMKTGEVFVDGQLQPFEKEIPSNAQRELVYWRLMHLSQGAFPEIKGFHIGWKATVDSEEIQHVVTVN